MTRVTRYFLCLLLLSLNSLYVWGLEITNVRPDLKAFNPGNNESSTIRFHINESAEVQLNIFDGRDLLIRTVNADHKLVSGDQALVWDGRDQSGRPVPSEAYHFTLIATSKDGKKVEHDLTDLTGGEEFYIDDAEWDSKNQKITYSFPKPARVNIRVGLTNGPLLRTLIDWVPRQGGEQEEDWNGKDMSGVLDLSRHPKRKIIIKAFALSENTILVEPLDSKVNIIRDVQWEPVKRSIKKAHKKRMYSHKQQPLESRGDFKIYLYLPEDMPKTKDDVPIISGKVPVRLEIDPKDASRAVNRRVEPVFYVDGLFAFENETGFLPMTWIWDASNTNKGIHYLTANMLGYEGNFGIATIQVFVDNK